MKPREWWDRAAAGNDWRHRERYTALAPEDRRTIERWTKAALTHEDAVVRALGARIAEDIQAASWGAGAPSLSRHLLLELYAIEAGRDLAPGAPVPRCGCQLCTGISDGTAPGDRRKNRRTQRRRTLRDLSPALDVDAARAVSILGVANLLGIEHRRGWALCPFHGDTSPSLHLNSRKQKAFCNPCGRSWDPIALVMELRGLTFVEAVKALAS